MLFLFALQSRKKNIKFFRVKGQEDRVIFCVFLY